MRFGSVCSGIEAASVAWEPLGWTAAWFAEVDRAASEVLAHRFPHVLNHGDMTLLAAKVRAREIEAPDILVGGTPCQGFSAAGLRGGLTDPRGQLTIAFVNLLDAIDEVRAEDGQEPCIVVWENVPGVYNMPDNAFGCFVAAIIGDDEALEPGARPDTGKSSTFWTWDKKLGLHRPKWPVAGYAAGPGRTAAWRTLDAQYFGLAQRRNRVFLVASAREGFDPADVLPEFDGVRRDSPPSREAGESVAGTLDARVDGGGFPGTDGACAGHVQPVCRSAGVTSDPAVPQWWDGRDVAQTLDAVLHKGQTMPEKNRFPAVLQPVAFGGNNQAGPIDVATARNAHAGPHGRLDFESETFVLEPIDPLNFAIMPMNSGKDYVARETDVAQPLMAAGPVGGNQGGDYIVQPIEVLPFDTTQITSASNYSSPRAGDPCHPLAAGAHPPAVCVTEPVTHTLKAEGFDASEDGTGRGQPIVPSYLETLWDSQEKRIHDISREIAPTISARCNGGGTVDGWFLEPVTMAVRRLMPVECEILQGFPPGWTDVPTGPKRKPAADGPRYKQCGNSMATKVMNWIGRRIQRHLSNNQFADLLGHNGGPDFSDLLG